MQRRSTHELMDILLSLRGCGKSSRSDWYEKPLLNNVSISMFFEAAERDRLCFNLLTRNQTISREQASVNIGARVSVEGSRSALGNANRKVIGSSRRWNENNA